MPAEGQGVVGVLAAEPLAGEVSARLEAAGHAVVALPSELLVKVGVTEPGATSLDVVLAQAGHPGAAAWIPSLVAAAVPILLLTDHPADPARVGVLGHLGPDEASGAALTWAVRHAASVGRAARDEGARRLLLAGQVASTVGHELNNALTYVMANLEHATDRVEAMQPPDQGLLDTLIEARQGVRRLASVVGELGKVARSPSTKVGPVQVAPLVEAALDMAHERLRGRARVRTDLTVRRAVSANEAKLFQVLLNLIINAALAIEPGHPDRNEVLVSTRWADRRVCLEVADTGVGIPAEHLDRIFEHFFTTRTAGRGSGIGLALCRRYIQEMGGELTVESAVGRGTTMRVVLDPARSTDPPPTLVPDVGPRRARVLVVDDEVLIGRAIQRALGADHDVVAVTSTREALAALERDPFDLVFTDVWLGAESGVDLYHAVVARWPELRHGIAFISGGPSDADAAMLEDLDVPRFRKPLTVDELRDAVDSVVSRR